MKKLLLLFVLLHGFMFFLILPSFAAPIEPVRTLDIPEIGAITLDGAADDGYSDSQDTDWGYPDQQEGYGGEIDFKADFQIAWDRSHLYILAVFSDDVEHDYQWGYSSPWMFDNFEVFLQLDTNTVTTSYDEHTIQLRICRGLDSVETPGRASRADWGYYMEAQAAGGWISEVAIPWTAVLAEGEGPELRGDYFNIPLGFDFAGADSDNSDGDETMGNRDYQVFWDLDGQDGTEDLAWSNTSTFGYISLMEVCGPWRPDFWESYSSSKLAPRLVPNPAINTIGFPDLTRECTVSLYSIQGVRVVQSRLLPGSEIDVTALQSGVYLAVIDGGKAVTFVKK